MKKYLAIAGLLIIGSLIFMAGTGLAENVRSGDNVRIAKDETVDSVLFTAGQNIDIEGTVNGDVYCAGMNVSISGKVNGDVFCAAQNLKLSGEIDGSIKLAGQVVDINSKSIQKIGIAGQNINISQDTKVEQDALLAGQNLTILGDVGRDLNIGGETISVNRSVGRNILGNVDRLVIGSDARVGGMIDVTSPNKVDVQPGAEVTGEVTQRQPKKSDNNSTFKPVGVLYMMFALLIVSLVLAVTFPKLFEKTDRRIRLVPGKTALVGFAGIFAMPLVIGLLIITIVGIPLAILILLAWLTTILISGPVLAYTIGKRIWSKSDTPILVMLIGSAILVVLYIIPVIGFFAVVAAGILGSGALWSEMFNLSGSETKPEQVKSGKKSK